MSQRTMIEGAPVTMGGREYIVPPLSLGQVKRLAPKIEAMANSGSELDAAGLDAVCIVLHAALSRNYPDLRLRSAWEDMRDEHGAPMLDEDGTPLRRMVGEPGVEDLLDLGNVRRVTAAMMGQSGLVPSGEARGEVSRSTGATSTPIF